MDRGRLVVGGRVGREPQPRGGLEVDGVPGQVDRRARTLSSAVVRQLLVGDVLWTAAQRTPGRIAATLDDRRVTFAELATATEVVCRALAQRGIGRGSRVVWQGDTTIDAIPLAM